jgi:hypothetical protein
VKPTTPMELEMRHISDHSIDVRVPARVKTRPPKKSAHQEFMESFVDLERDVRRMLEAVEEDARRASDRESKSH